MSSRAAVDVIIVVLDPTHDPSQRRSAATQHRLSPQHMRDRVLAYYGFLEVHMHGPTSNLATVLPALPIFVPCRERAAIASCRTHAHDQCVASPTRRCILTRCSLGRSIVNNYQHWEAFLARSFR